MGVTGLRVLRVLLLVLAAAAVVAPQAPAGQLEAGSVSMGDSHACAVRDAAPGQAGQAVCWGDNYGGALGDGATAERWRPVPVTGFGAALAVRAGTNFSCGIEAGVHGLFCWGSGAGYRLGGNSLTDSLVPGPVLVADPPGFQPFEGAETVAAATNGNVAAHGCATGPSGELYCWGNNEQGQLGNGTSGSGAESAVATPVTNPDTGPPGVLDAIAVATGDEHTCAIQGGSDGTLFCWGEGDGGRLGTGDTASRSLPAPVADPDSPGDRFDDVTAVATGWAHSCAIRGGLPGEVFCWGNNLFGQLGNGTDSPSPVPVAVVDPDHPGQGLDGMVAIAAGRFHTCALNVSGGLFCWGNNGNGELGNGGTPSNSKVPVRVSDPEAPDQPFTNLLAVTAGGSRTCAIRGTQLPGKVFCWGWNPNGQLGDGTDTDRKLPAAVLDGRNELLLNRAGDGSGTVEADPAGFPCGTGCLRYEPGTEVTLTAVPQAGSLFTGWSGDCSPAGPTCTVTMDTDRAVTANFGEEPAAECPAGQVGTPPDCHPPLVSRAPRVTVSRTALRRDRAVVIRVRVENLVAAPARKVRVCARVPKRLVRVAKRCVRLGVVGPRAVKVARFRMRATSQTRSGQRVKLGFRTVSEVLKTKHDTVKNSINNVR